MKPTGPIKLASELLDLPLLDKDDRWCGVVDDIELDGSAGREMRIKALLVGPGAYKARMPGWLFALSRMIGGDHVSRVPLGEIQTISSAVHLKCAAEKLGLHVVEDKVRGWIPHGGAM
jgi:hypothetical protein